MNNNLSKKISIIVAIATMITTFSACSKSSVTTDTKKGVPPLVTLEFLAPAPVTSINDFDSVLNKFYEQTKDTLNVKIHFTFTTFDNIGQKASLKLASGEQLDSVFAAQWTNPSINQMVSKGQLTNLDKYFTDDKLPGLKKAFNQDYLKNNSFADSKGEYHVYGIPFSHNFDAGAVVYYRKDLADKYGLGDLKSYDDLTKYLDAVKANEKGMTPFSFLGSTDGIAPLLEKMVDPVSKKHNTLTINGMGGRTGIYGVGGVSIAIKDDGSLYASNNAVSPYSDPEYQKLAPLSDLDPLRGFKMAKEWYTKGYLEKDVLSQKDAEGQFAAGKAASYTRGLDTYTTINQRLTSSISGAKLGYMILDNGERSNTPKSLGNTFQSWNFMAIPTTSTNTDRTMQFLNWLYSDMKNHDLFELGIEGKHWTAVGDTKYSLPAGVDEKTNYNLPGFILTWNPTMQKYSSTTPDAVVSELNKLSDTNFFYKQPDAGFSFVSDSVKSETAKMNDLSSFIRALENGVMDDIPGQIKKVQSQYDQAGYAKLKDEALKQFSAWLKNNPYKGQ